MEIKAGTILPQIDDSEWMGFPGGELEGRRPKVLCVACRDQLRHAVDPGGTSGTGRRAAESAVPGPSRRFPSAICFTCYLAERARDRALQAAGDFNSTTEARFQSILPLEPVDRSRLARLRADRAAVRAAHQSGAGRYVDKRRRAQIAARHALQQIGARLRTGTGPHSTSAVPRGTHAPHVWSTIHAAELQLPESWLPFVMSR